MKKTKEFTKPKMTFGDTLRFIPYSWAKLLWMRDRGPTEVAGYGITATEDPLLVTDFILIKQKCTSVTFDLDPKDGVEHAERMMDQGIPPWACMNILCHTHPGSSPNPSGTDEDNFKASFSHPDWAIMFIIAKDGATYCRLKVNVGPGITKNIKCDIDWSIPFLGSDAHSWDEEYKTKVVEDKFSMTQKGNVADPLLSTTYKNPDYPSWLDEKDNQWDEELCKGDKSINDVCYFNEAKNEWIIYDPIMQKWYIDEGEHTPEIEKPDEPLASQIIAWAEEYSLRMVL